MIGALPPDITGRTSTTSPSPTTLSLVSSSSPRMTRTVPARMSSSTSSSLTRRRPLSSTSRFGLRRMIFTRWGSPTGDGCVTSIWVVLIIASAGGAHNEAAP